MESSGRLGGENNTYNFMPTKRSKSGLTLFNRVKEVC